MPPICIWYHCLLRSEERPIDPDYAFDLIAKQMHALNDSGLAEAAQEIHVCVNGTESDGQAISTLVPEKATITCHGKYSRTEIPTMEKLRAWLPGKDEWFVFYHHTKGVSTPNQADGWRRRMEINCVDLWERCVWDLEHGFDTAGCHWLTPEGNPGIIKSPFYGGTFWWAKASYLKTLPPLPPPTWANRYEAEAWIGKGNPRPKARDFHPGWPVPNVI